MCTPPCPLGSLQHSRKPITGFKGGFATGGNGGGLLRSCRREGKGENEREREGGGNSALVVGDRRLCRWGPGRAEPRPIETNFMYFRLHKALLVDR